jgi:hypothetical protein
LLDPLQTSGLSHRSTAGRHTAVLLASGGHVGVVPVQVSTKSHTPAAARHTVVLGAIASGGQAGLIPSQFSATSQTPAAGRHWNVAGLTASRRAGDAGARAGLGGVADTHRRPTHGASGDQLVGGTGHAGPAARLGDVAHISRWTAHGPGRLEEVAGAEIARPIARLGHVARTGGGPADGDALHVGRTGRMRAVADLGDVTDALGRATHGPARLDHVRRARITRPGTELGAHIAGPCDGPADGSGGLELAGGGAAVVGRAIGDAMVARLTHVDDAVAAHREGGGRRSQYQQRGQHPVSKSTPAPTALAGHRTCLSCHDCPLVPDWTAAG